MEFKKYLKRNERVALNRIEGINPVERGIPFAEIGPMIGSVKLLGILNPVVLMDDKGELKILSGQRRLLAARKLGMKEIDAFIIESGDVGAEEILNLVIFENVAHRRMNLIEKSFMLRKISALSSFKPKEIIERYFSVLNLEKSLRIYEMLFSLKKLSNYWKNYVITKNPTLQMSCNMAKFSAGDQELLSELLNKANLSLSELNEVISLVLDLEKIKSKKLEEILGIENITGILNDEKMDRIAKGKKLREVIRNIRSPRISEIELDLKKGIGLLHLPKGIRLNPPKNLDEGKFTFELDFNEPKDLEEKISWFREISRSRELYNLTSMF